MKKKYAALFVSGALLISNAGLLKAESFEGRESEMNAKCAVIKDTKTQEECSRYKDYLQSKSDNLDKEISDIKSQIASVKGDVEKVSKLIADNNKKIASYEKEISSIQASIDQTQSSISDLKKQIKEKEDSIKERDKQMRARLLEMQAYTRYEYILPVDGEAYLVEDDTQIVHDACLHIARIDKDVSGDDLKTNDPFLHAAVSYVDRISIDHFDI